MNCIWCFIAEDETMWHLGGLGLHAWRQVFYDFHFIIYSVFFQVWELHMPCSFSRLLLKLLCTTGSLVLGMYFLRTLHLFSECCTPRPVGSCSSLPLPWESLKAFESTCLCLKQWLHRKLTKILAHTWMYILQILCGIYISVHTQTYDRWPWRHLSWLYTMQDE